VIKEAKRFCLDAKPSSKYLIKLQALVSHSYFMRTAAPIKVGVSSQYFLSKNGNISYSGYIQEAWTLTVHSKDCIISFPTEI
jgi:hypothetical protein